MESARSFHQLPYYIRIKNFRKELDKQLDPQSQINTIDLAQNIDLKRKYLLRQSEIKKKEENVKNKKILNDNYSSPYYNMENKLLDSNTSRMIELDLVNVTKLTIDTGNNALLTSKRISFEDSQISPYDISKSTLKFPQVHESRSIRKNLFRDYSNSKSNSSVSISKLSPRVNMPKIDYKNKLMEKLNIKQNEKIQIMTPKKSPTSIFNSQEKSKFSEFSASKNELPSSFSNIKLSKKRIKMVKMFEFDFLNKETISLENFEKKILKLIEIIDIIDNTIKFNFVKKKVDFMILKIIHIAINIECKPFYFYLFQTHGKIMFLCKEYSRAVFIFKSLNRINENNFVSKLKAYKNIARCYHDAQNYQNSIFYTIKMLQCSWGCKSHKFELQAYDFLGMNYYYLGQLKMANYYHEKMMHLNLEPCESEIKAIGIEKMLNKIKEEKVKSKKVKVVDINSSNPPSSEDEFTLTIPNEYAFIEEINGDYSPMKKSSSKKASEIKLFNRHKNMQNSIKQNEYRLVGLTKRVINQIPPNDEVLITHRSSLRFIESYDHVDDNINPETIVKYDKVKKKLLKLKLIIKTAINFYEENYAFKSNIFI